MTKVDHMSRKNCLELFPSLIWAFWLSQKHVVRHSLALAGSSACLHLARFIRGDVVCIYQQQYALLQRVHWVCRQNGGSLGPTVQGGLSIYRNTFHCYTSHSSIEPRDLWWASLCNRLSQESLNYSLLLHRTHPFLNISNYISKFSARNEIGVVSDLALAVFYLPPNSAG